MLAPARVARIDVRYDYPAGDGLAPRVEEDGGDVYGPAGTRVRLTVRTDKPVRDGALTLENGSSLALAATGDRLLTGDPVRPVVGDRQSAGEPPFNFIILFSYLIRLI